MTHVTSYVLLAKENHMAIFKFKVTKIKNK